ncbi:2-oxoacid dehydrogenases acyltransferase (catalytic domain) domain-containing protein [Ditylenchus destructor]|uniref:Dihydrolipoamide acetyltransferase component of pyruvate dehydrogenase complex n=1 Tax=Ditylenchus destructor TaxID=166010 RepID=A0AAD4N0E5_9BILA|nr:2-oxoacid dehydrogenases acyltransferase (catalytic domain) domain-containing protein [Ditylenchus destructor]
MNSIFLRGSRLALFSQCRRPAISRLSNHLRSFHFSSLLNGLVQFKLSDIGEGIAEVQVKEWHVKVGDQVNEFDDICVVQSDKASVTITSRYAGVIKRLYYEVDDIAQVGQPLIDIDTPDESNERTSTETHQKNVSADTPSEPTAKSPNVQSTDYNNKILAAPAVRRMVRESNVDVSKINGTGKDGRILKEDILNYLGKDKGTLKMPTQTGPSTNVKVSLYTSEDTIVPIRGYGRAMIKSMSESLKIPHFGYSDEYCMDNLIEARNQLNSEAKKRGIKLSYMPLLIKATSLALKEFPIINSSMDEKMENLIYKSSHNISLAMDTTDGLVVPNIKECNMKNVWEIAAELDRLLRLGKEKKFSTSDLTGGTFSISNIGAIGSGTYVNPVIFAPQVAILALGRVRKLPRFDEQENLVAKNVVNVSFSADHRVVDGATMARFSNLLKEYIEHPSSMLADMR